MNIIEYYKKLGSEALLILDQTIENTTPFGKAHYISSCLFDFSKVLFDKYEKEMLVTVSGQVEAATLSLSLGLYRQAFSSLRLAFEMGLSIVGFSINKMEHYEWLEGNLDIKWSKLIDPVNGVVSERFTNAFFSELTSFAKSYNIKAASAYRHLSEYVHGNFETWSKSGVQLKINTILVRQFFEQLMEVYETILFTLCVRYLKSLTKENLEEIEFIQEELNHIEPIRLLFKKENE